MIDLTSKALLAASIRNRLFASRDTVDEALNYAIDTIERIQGTDKAAVYTMLHVVLNTVADKITALPDQLPEPPAEVRIAHADLPDTGAVDLDTRIAEIADERIRRLNIQRQIEKTIEEWFNDNVDLEHEIEKHIENSIDFPEIVKEVLLNNLTLTVSVE